MTSTPDTVLKNFGEASETHFVMFSVLQLILSLDTNETTAPYDINAKRVYELCRTDSHLPRNIRDFILWQCNIKQRDNEQILNIEIPHGLCKPYDVMTVKLEAASSTERTSLIQGCIDEIDSYLGKLHEVCAILEAAEDRFNTVEMRLLYGHGQSEELSNALKPQDTVLEEARAEIEALHAELEGYTMPSLASFAPTIEKMHGLIRRLSDAHLIIRDTVRRYNLKQGDQ